MTYNTTFETARAVVFDLGVRQTFEELTDREQRLLDAAYELFITELDPIILKEMRKTHVIKFVFEDNEEFSDISDLYTLYMHGGIRKVNVFAYNYVEWNDDKPYQIYLGAQSVHRLLTDIYGYSLGDK